MKTTVPHSTPARPPRLRKALPGLFLAILLSLQSLSAATPGAWEKHSLQRGDGHGGWVEQPAEHRLMQHQDGGSYTMPFGVQQMDNGEVILAGSWNDGRKNMPEVPIIAFSRDRGNTWTKFETVPGALGRPVMLTDLGQGHLVFQTDPPQASLAVQHFSADYGRTWPDSQSLQAAANGGTGSGGEGPLGFLGGEGNAMVDRSADGKATAMAQIGWNYAKGEKWPAASTAGGILRWSRDGGKTWANETIPGNWRFQTTFDGKTITRGVSEGSLVRAANGWLVAALRTDMPPRFLQEPNDDSLEGTGTSISKDDGKTWSPIQVLFDSGRHHAHLLKLRNGDLLMTLIVREDIEMGAQRPASNRRGCEALISHDNGLTWDLGHKYIIDRFDYLDSWKWYDGKCGHLSSTLLDDGSILTVYGNYIKSGIVMVRWNPEGSDP